MQQQDGIKISLIIFALLREEKKKMFDYNILMGRSYFVLKLNLFIAPSGSIIVGIV